MHVPILGASLLAANAIITGERDERLYPLSSRAAQTEGNFTPSLGGNANGTRSTIPPRGRTLGREEIELALRVPSPSAPFGMTIVAGRFTQKLVVI